MLSPIAAGGRVVMLKQFDTIQVWSHILGIVVNQPQPLPKVDLVGKLPLFFNFSYTQKSPHLFKNLKY